MLKWIAAAVAATAAIIAATSTGAAASTSTAPSGCASQLLERRVNVVSVDPASARSAASRGIAAMRATGANWYLRVGEGYDCGGSYRINWRYLWTTNPPERLARLALPPCNSISQVARTVDLNRSRVRGGVTEYPWHWDVTPDCVAPFRSSFVDWLPCTRIIHSASSVYDRRVRDTDWRLLYSVTTRLTLECTGDNRHLSHNIWTWTIPDDF